MSHFLMKLEPANGPSANDDFKARSPSHLSDESEEAEKTYSFLSKAKRDKKGKLTSERRGSINRGESTSTTVSTVNSTAPTMSKSKFIFGGGEVNKGKSRFMLNRGQSTKFFARGVSSASTSSIGSRERLTQELIIEDS